MFFVHFRYVSMKHDILWHIGNRKCHVSILPSYWTKRRDMKRYKTTRNASNTKLSAKTRNQTVLFKLLTKVV